MKEELASISSFVDSTTGLKQVPVTILAKFVVLFRERVRNNNSQHAYIDKQDFTYLISEQLTPFYDDSAAIASIANQLLDSVLKATHNMDSSTLIENQAAVDIQQFVLVLMLCLEVNSEDQRDREQIFYGLVEGIEAGQYFQLEKVLSTILYFVNKEWSVSQARVKARSLVRLLEETYNRNLELHAAQERRKKDKSRPKKMWDKEEVIDLNKNLVLKKILLKTPYMPDSVRSCFLNVTDNQNVSAKFFEAQHKTNTVPSKQVIDYKPKTRPPPKHKLEEYTSKILVNKKIRKSQKRYRKLDVYAMNTIQEDEVNFEALVKRLTKLAKTPEERARVFYAWVVNNIEYDPTEEHSNGEEVFKNRKAKSKGFARMFARLCEVGGIYVEVIPGHTKDRGLNGDSGHCWNSVAVNDTTYFVDCALAAGTYDGHSFHKSLKDYYFLVPPESFIDHHFPDDPTKQHLPIPISFEEYTARNHISYKGCEYGLTIATTSHPTPQIELTNAHTIRLSFQGDLDIEYKVILKDAETGEETVGTVEPVKKRKHKVRVKIPEPLPKLYTLELYGRPRPAEDDGEAASDDDEDEPKQKTEVPFDLLISWKAHKIIVKKEKQADNPDDPADDGDDQPDDNADDADDNGDDDGDDAADDDDDQ